jgi:hypothetical protein
MIIFSIITLINNQKIYSLCDVTKTSDSIVFGNHIKQLLHPDYTISRNISFKYELLLYSIKQVENEEFSNIEEFKHKYMHKLI